MYDYEFPDAALTAWLLFRQTRDVLYKLAERELHKLGLTHEKISALWVCKVYPSPLTPAEMSRALFRESQTVAALVTGMEKEGLVKRVSKRKGHPFTEIKLTAKGEETYRSGIEVITGLARKIMSSLSAKELEHFLELLRKLRQETLQELGIELKPRPEPADEFKRL